MTNRIMISVAAGALALAGIAHAAPGLGGSSLGSYGTSASDTSSTNIDEKDQKSLLEALADFIGLTPAAGAQAGSSFVFAPRSTSDAQQDNDECNSSEANLSIPSPLKSALEPAGGDHADEVAITKREPIYFAF